MQKNSNNIVNVNRLRECTSCQVCAAVCPKNAITISLNQDGFYRPYVNETLCVGCGLCQNVCYKYDSNIRQTSKENLKHYSLYSARSKSQPVLSTTTSGGLAYHIACKLFEAGYKVIGVVYDSEYDCAKHKAAVSLDDINAFKGSKYIQSYSVDAFRDLVRNVRNERYAVFGLPCQIYALAKLLEKIHQRERCILIDLYCHGCPSYNVWRKTLDLIKQKSKTKTLDKIEWRSKAHGWGNFCISAQSSGKVVYESTPLNNEFYSFFFSNQILNDACGDCLLRGTLEYSDIRLGDFWGKKYKKDFFGVSAVSVISISGKKVFDIIRDNITFSEEKYDDFLSNQSWGVKYGINPNDRLTLLSDFGMEMSLDNILKKHRPPFNVIRLMKLFVKQLLFFMPIEVTKFVKRMI